MNFMRSLVQFIACCFVLSAVLAIVPLRLSAQDATGRVVGFVYDQSGAVISGAHILVTNVATQIQRETTADSSGYYQVLSLPVGSYIVSCDQKGFSPTATSPNKLEINQSLRVDLSLKVGPRSETVTVESTSSPIETINPTLGSTVSDRTVQDMPLNGRNVLDLAVLQPGVMPADNPGDTTGTSASMAYSISGGRSDSNTYILDGGINNDLLDNNVVYNPNPDSIQEFKVLTSNFTAEYGRNAGGIVTVVTKSGSNEFHGSAYDFLRNTDLDANNYFSNFNGEPRNVLHRNQYGGTVGGPIKRDKLFFFVSYQGQKFSELIAAQTVPLMTPAELQGNFSGSPNAASIASFLEANPFFQPNSGMAAQAIIDPTKFDSIAQAYIKAGLVPTSAGGQGSFQNPQIENANEITGKFDFQATNKDHFTITLGRNKPSQLLPGPGGIPGFDSSTTITDQFFNFAYIRIVSSSILNEFRATAQRSNILQAVPAAKYPTPSQLGIMITPDDPTGPSFIEFPALGNSGVGPAIGFSVQGPSRLTDNTFAYSDVFSWTRGKHTMKFGGFFSAYQDNQVFAFIVNGLFDFVAQDNNGNPFATGDAFANFLLGAPFDFVQSPAAPSNIRSKSTYVFAQDEWHLANNFTVTYGLRYEYNTPKSDTEGRLYSIFPGRQSTVFPGAPVGLLFPGDKGAPFGVNFPQTRNFAPRFGFAWQPFKDAKTSIRGGIGLFYDVLKAEDNFQFNGQVPFASSGSFSFPAPPIATVSGYDFFGDPYGSTGNPNPFPSKPIDHNVNFANTFGTFTSLGTGATVVNPHLHTPYTYQYNISFQHQLSPKMAFQAAYVGSSSHGLTALVDIDPFDPATLSSPNPQRFLNETPGNFPALTNPDCNINPTCTLPPGFNPNVPNGSFGQEQEFRNVSNANFNALQLSLTQQGHQIPVLGNVYYTFGYTWAHSIDEASGFRQVTSVVPFFFPHIFRASSDFDVRHYVAFSGGWDLPFNHGPKLLVKGWSLYPIITWRTGYPFSVNAGLSTSDVDPGPSGAGDAGLANADQFAPVQYVSPSRANNNQFFNPAAFINPATGSSSVTAPYGTSFRNEVRGPSRANFDLSLAKVTPLYKERATLELRVDAFNLLNHTEFQGLDTSAADIGSTFGQVTSAYDPRILQVAAHLRF